MSARVVWGQIAPAGKPHPAIKWSLLMVLLVVVVLGVPKQVAAAPPSVQAPTGPMSGGVFTGPYTFNTYISCSGGFSFSSSYTNSLDGTHTFAFWGSADGSLLVAIDGGGLQLITSCGDPFTGPDSNVSNYTVSKNTSPPPTPTPTPPPTPTPTPTPTPSPGGGTGGGTGGTSGGGNTGGSGGGSHASGGGATPLPTPPDGATPAPSVGGAPAQPAPTVTPAVSRSTNGSAKKPRPAAAGTSAHGMSLLGITRTGLIGLLLLILALAVLRSHRARSVIESAWRRLAVRLEPYTFRLRLFLRSRFKGRAANEPRRRFSHRQHTGKLVSHHHTDYPSLVFLLLVSAVLAGAVSWSGHAENSQLSLTVLGPPPAVGATIDDPADGTHVTSSTVTVRGTCPQNLMVELYRNTVFAGSTLCDTGGLYNLVISLVPNQNNLVAKDVDGLGQYGPDSATVVVFYDVLAPPPTPTPTPTPTPVQHTGATPTPRVKATPKPTPVPAPAPFYVDSAQHYFQGADTHTPASWSLTIHGGQPPYIVSWEWGDGATETAPQSSATTISASHHYAAPGTYRVTVRVTDAANRQAVISLVAVINGYSAGSVAGPIEPNGNLIFIWPLLIITAVVVLSFWLGERHRLLIEATEPSS